MTTGFYYIVTFDTTSDVMQAETLIKLHFQTAVMPIPQEISSGCGLALRFLHAKASTIQSYLKSFPLSGTLYQMEIKKKNGHHPIKRIMAFPTAIS